MAYEKQRLDDAENTDLISLTTGDVFRWLENEGLFLRKATSKPIIEAASRSAIQRTRRPTIKAEEAAVEMYCRFCGLHYQYHPNTPTVEMSSLRTAGEVPVKLEDMQDSIPSTSAPTCTAFSASYMENKLVYFYILTVACKLSLGQCSTGCCMPSTIVLQETHASEALHMFLPS